MLNRDSEDRLPEWEEIAAASCSVQNMLLAITAKELAAYWSSPSMISKARKFLQIKENQKCLGMLYIGCTKPELKFSSERKNLTEDVEWM